jgi:hypothetical protein
MRRAGTQHPGGLRNQMNPAQANSTLKPGGLSNGDSPGSIPTGGTVSMEVGAVTRTVQPCRVGFPYPALRESAIP